VRRALGAAVVAVALLAVPAVATAADVTAAPVRHAQVGDVDLAYRSIGSGKPLVMIMGLGGTMDAWLPQLVQRVGKGRRVIVFDNRGTGRSSAGTKAVTVAQMAADTHGLIAKLRLKQPDVLGWSMGGFIAQRLALTHPRDVDHLVLAATTAGGPTSTPPDAAAIQALAGDNIATLLGFLFPLPAQQAAADTYVASIAKWSDFSITVPADVQLAQLTTSAQWFATGGDAKRIRAPTLVGGGDDDELIPVANQVVLGKTIKGARTVLYRGAAHGFLAQDWQDFGGRVARFLRA
jgi:pimeloyl-ACP methyl ester carboxylesterase